MSLGRGKTSIESCVINGVLVHGVIDWVAEFPKVELLTVGGEVPIVMKPGGYQLKSVVDNSGKKKKNHAVPVEFKNSNRNQAHEFCDYARDWVMRAVRDLNFI